MSLVSRHARVLVLLCLILLLLATAATPASAGKPRPTAAAYNLYFGDLHAHTSYSDGASGYTPWDAFAVGKTTDVDFMALTEHYSTSNAYEPWTMDEAEWADLKDAAASFTDDSFVAIPAYEYWLVADNGELNVYNVPDLPPKQEFLGPDRLPLFMDWLSAQPGAVAQFNHPTYVTHEFKDFFGWSEGRDSVMGLVEVFNDVFTESSYVKALDEGWHLMPSANSDTHSPDWIVGNDVRTVLLAARRTPQSLYDAMRAQRGYATMDKNLHVSFTVNNAVIGSTLPRPAASYTASIEVWDPDALAGDAGDAITALEIVADGGKVVRSFKPSAAAGMGTVTWKVRNLPADAPYFWLRVSTESDDFNHVPGVTAWTAPVWTGR